jgi:prepilin-type N-terminal cleavage/methylation domain-containing protein
MKPHVVGHKTRPWLRKQLRWRHNQGFSLVELAIVSLISAVVLLIAWTGVMTAMNLNQVAEAKSARANELIRAIDFMNNEVRTARSINRTATATADGSSVTLESVVTSSGLNVAALGNYGSIGLYLERPMQTAPAVCPADGPNAGAPPPTPSDFDRVVYDIRPNPTGWLSPRVITRYGRLPSADGTVDPCSNPVASEIMADAIAATLPTPPDCHGVLAGEGGFQTCVNGNQIQLLFQSDIEGVNNDQFTSSVTTRNIEMLQPEVTTAPESTPSRSLTLYAAFKNDNLQLSWGFSDGSSAPSYRVKSISASVTTVQYTGPQESIVFKFKKPKNTAPVCFVVEAVNGDGTSNTACF